MHRLISVGLIALFSVPTPVLAATEAWMQLETEVALSKGLSWRPNTLVFETDVRYRSTLAGTERVQLRWGPEWDLHEMLALKINHTAYNQQPTPGTFITEQRAELEPTFKGTIGGLDWEDRNRLEFRWRPTSTRWRYRNQLRVEQEVAPGWIPFVSDEVFVDLSGMVLNENRISFGLAHDRNGSGWEAGYTFRTGHGPGTGIQDHLLVFGGVFGLEDPILSSAP